MANEQKNGHFSSLPHIIPVAYRGSLTRGERYLYEDLRRQFWDKKTRGISLRELGEITEYKKSALGEMLPHLQEAGLIRDEVRREIAKNGKPKGQPKHHITIVDIWELNAKFFSLSEDVQREISQLTEARSVAETIQKKYRAYQKRQSKEKQRQATSRPISGDKVGDKKTASGSSKCPLQRTEVSATADRSVRQNGHNRAETELPKDTIKDNLKDNKRESSNNSRDVPAAAPGSLSHSSSFSSSSQKETLSSQEEKVLQTYQEAQEARGRKISHGARNLEAARLLADIQPTKEQLLSCEQYCRVFLKNGVDLLDIAKNWDKWQDKQQQEKEASEQQPDSFTPRTSDAADFLKRTGMRNVTLERLERERLEREQDPIERERLEREQLEREQANQEYGRSLLRMYQERAMQQKERLDKQREESKLGMGV